MGPVSGTLADREQALAGPGPPRAGEGQQLKGQQPVEGPSIQEGP